MKLLRVFALAAALLGLAAQAHAQTAPAGWTVAKSATQWVATSPDQGRGLTVKLVHLASTKPAGSLDLWFPEAHQRAAWRYGEVVSVGRTSSMGQVSRLLASSVVVKPKAGGRASVLGYAYDTSAGRQMILIVMPATLGTKNPAYKSAFSAMETFWNAGGAYTPAP